MDWFQGAGDQGVMIGYACDETKQLMPMPVVLANRIVRELSACRQSSYIQGILPDGKAQVTVEYEDGKPVRLDSVVVSCQHTEEKDLKRLEAEIRKKVLLPALRPLPPDEETKIYINPSGRFVCGGLDADTGLTGRKLMVDSYGSMVPHGGGAFSGKDCSKVDRSAAYMTRYIAKNIVAAGLASKCQVSLAYAIGVAQPVMVQVDTFGTGKVYHKSYQCTHLKLAIRAGNVSDVADLRNEYQGKYYPCEKCKAKSASGMIYYTASGDRYHASLGCSGLKRNIRAVKLSEVGGRGACSRCGR